MKLAEALCVRADLQNRIAQLEQRLKSVAKIQEGDVPEESPEDLFAELHQAASQLEDLIYRINCTNLHTFSDRTHLFIFSAPFRSPFFHFWTHLEPILQ